MFKKQLAALLAATAFVVPALSHAAEHHGGDASVARAYIKEIQKDGKSYLAAHKSDFFKELAKGQKPRATVVTCSDSRVHTNMLDKTPEGDLFMVRNIGNQLATAKGSVQYGVNHLGSSLLLFIGHSSCGAIKAAGGDYSTLEDPIKKELDTINITKGSANIDGVKTNVNNQVTAAMQEFGDKVKNGELLIVGAVYDFADDMKQGAGKLNIINMNGETDPAVLRNMPATEEKSGHGHDHEHH
ncbi:MAG: carbonic anhydrase [Nitrosomonadales bacterium]|nr:carbonic anhydrase [Nitrosomonadales bacterium]